MANTAKSPEAAKTLFEYYKKEYPDTDKSWEDFYEKPEEKTREEKEESEEGDKKDPAPEEGSFATKEDKPFLKDIGDSLRKADLAVEKKRQKLVNSTYKAFKSSTSVTNGLADIGIGITSLFAYSDPESKDLDNGIKALSKFSKTGGDFAKDARKFFLDGGLKKSLNRTLDKAIDAAIPDVVSGSLEGTLNTAMKYTPMLGDQMKKYMVDKGYVDGKNKFKVKEFVKSAGLSIGKSMVPGVAMTAYKGAKAAMGVAGVTWRTAGRAIKVPSSMVDSIMKKAKTENKPNRGFIEALSEKTKSVGKAVLEPGEIFGGAKSNYKQNMSDAFRILKGTAAGWDENADVALKRQSKQLSKISAPLGEMMDDVVGTIWKRGLNSQLEEDVKGILIGVGASAAVGAAGSKIKGLDMKSKINVGDSKIKGFTKKHLDKYLAKQQNKMSVKAQVEAQKGVMRAKAAMEANKSLMSRAWGKVWTTAAETFEDAPKESKNNKTASDADLDAIQKDIAAGMNKLDDFDLEVFELLGSKKPMGEWTHQDITNATFEIFHGRKNKKQEDEKLKDEYLKYMLQEFMSFDETDALVFKKCLEKYGDLEEKNLLRTLKTLSAEDFMKAKKELSTLEDKSDKKKPSKKKPAKKKKDPRFS